MLDVTSALGFGFAGKKKIRFSQNYSDDSTRYLLGITILPVSSSPFVIPDVYSKKKTPEHLCTGQIWDNSLYSFPVCTVSVFTTSPAFTCFRAGLSFLGGLGYCGMGIGWSTTTSSTSVAELMVEEIDGGCTKSRVTVNLPMSRS